jgi:hypothetical protein
MEQVAGALVQRASSLHPSISHGSSNWWRGEVELVVAWRELLWLMVGSGRPDLLFTHKWMHFVNKVLSAR